MLHKNSADKVGLPNTCPPHDIDLLIFSLSLAVFLRELQVPHREGQGGHRKGSRLADGHSEQLHHGGLARGLAAGVEDRDALHQPGLRAVRKVLLRDPPRLLGRRSLQGTTDQAHHSYHFLLFI